MTQGFQLDGAGPEAYERYLVPTFFAPCADQLLQLSAVEPGERVLDLACGTGILARRAVAADGAAGAVEWRAADAATLPLADASFDGVFCQQGLQFFSDQPGALREAHRVLAPGGRLAVAVWRSIDHNSVFPVLVEALDRYAGAEAAELMRAPFAGPGRDELRRLLTDAGFDRILIRIGVIAVRFPSPREFLRQEVVSSPLAGPVGALDADRLDALIDELDRTLAPYVDDDGILFPMQTWLAAASR